MPAETLKCPMCGASASSDASKCDHCGAVLATVACPSCFGMIFQGSKYCSHCGARAERFDEETASKCKCPHCKESLGIVKIGEFVMLECPKCQGLWSDNQTAQAIYVDREKQSAVLGLPFELPDAATRGMEPVRYIPCPVCGDLMNRVNFANCSHVIVDVCRVHGTWFDKDELRMIVEFIRAGGLDKARAREIEGLERKKASLEMDVAKAQFQAYPLSTTSDNWDKAHWLWVALEVAVEFFTSL